MANVVYFWSILAMKCTCIFGYNIDKLQYAHNILRLSLNILSAYCSILNKFGLIKRILLSGKVMCQKWRTCPYLVMR